MFSGIVRINGKRRMGTLLGRENLVPFKHDSLMRRKNETETKHTFVDILTVEAQGNVAHTHMHQERL